MGDPFTISKYDISLRLEHHFLFALLCQLLAIDIYSIFVIFMLYC